MPTNYTLLKLSAVLAGSLILFAGSAAQSATISGTTQALGISWTLAATDDVDALYSASYDVQFSVRADIPSDLSIIMDEGSTISPTWIASAEARIAGLNDFMLVSAPGGVGGWADLSGPSANNCQNISGFASACAESNSDSDAADITAGASHTWTWVGNVDDLAAVFAEDLSGLQHVGAHLENERHRRGWNVSEEFSQAIPEPSAALVFGLGMTLAATRTRRPRSHS